MNKAYNRKMKNVEALVLLMCAVAVTGCNSNSDKVTEGPPVKPAVVVGGQPAFTLERPKNADAAHAHFLSAEILPGRGMMTYQVKAYLPGKGEINLLESPPLSEAPQILNGGPDDFMGNKSFSLGGAILLPYANRIRGKLSPDGTSLQTTVLGKTVTLSANWKGKNPGAIKNAMHGLILASRMDKVSTDSNANQSSVTGILHAGDFQGHWLSKTDVETKVSLQDDAFVLSVTAKNVGGEPLPMGIGWHPYFVLPSGNREQVKLHLPATRRALVDNYDDVFPTGKIVPVAGTPYDFTAAGGAPLNKLFMDDSFLNLQKTPEGYTVIELSDPAAKYGLRITAMSKEVSAIQVYAPVDKKFIVIEPQFNWADPYSKVWSGKDTGMAVLQPGQSVTYSVKLEFIGDVS